MPRLTDSALLASRCRAVFVYWNCSLVFLSVCIFASLKLFEFARFAIVLWAR